MKLSVLHDFQSTIGHCLIEIFHSKTQPINVLIIITSSHLKRMSTLDSSWVVSAGANGLAAHNSPAWLSLYLSVCKLLDLALALPAHKLPQFQMYRWAFVSEGTENNNMGGRSSAQPERTKLSNPVMNGNQSTNSTDSDQVSSSQTVKSSNGHKHLYQQDFVPYVVRVARLLLHKVNQYTSKRIKFKKNELYHVYNSLNCSSDKYLLLYNRLSK